MTQYIFCVYEYGESLKIYIMYVMLRDVKCCPNDDLKQHKYLGGSYQGVNGTQN